MKIISEVRSRVNKLSVDQLKLLLEYINVVDPPTLEATETDPLKCSTIINKEDEEDDEVDESTESTGSDNSDEGDYVITGEVDRQKSEFYVDANPPPNIKRWKEYSCVSCGDIGYRTMARCNNCVYENKLNRICVHGLKTRICGKHLRGLCPHLKKRKCCYHCDINVFG